MHDNTIATVGELIAALKHYDPATPVRRATQPGYPLENLLGRVACTPVDAEYEGPTRTDPPVVWLGAGRAGPVPTPYEVPKTVVRRFTENGCEVTAIVADPADAQQTLYGTVTHNGALVGSYYCADRVRQSDWHIVTALGFPLTLDCQPVNPVSEGAAVLVLTTILTARDSYEVEQRLRDATQPPRR